MQDINNNKFTFSHPFKAPQPSFLYCLARQINEPAKKGQPRKIDHTTMNLTGQKGQIKNS